MITVIGAGPAGLAAAWRAAQAGHEVAVIERAPAVGGMAGSFDVAGQRVDHGSHRLHPSTRPDILGALHELLGNDLQLRPRNGRINLLGRWVGFPLRPGDVLRNAPRGFAARVARDALLSPLRRTRADTFAEVIRAGLGPAVLNEFYAPYARKLWDAHPEDLDGELARRRVSKTSIRSLWPWHVVRSRNMPGPERNGFWYPRRGFGQISEALAEAATHGGADIQLGCGVRALVPPANCGGDGWTVQLDDGREYATERVWSTAPLGVLARLSGQPAGERLRHRSMVLLYVALERNQWTPYDAHYFPGPDITASRISEPRNYRDNPDDPEGVTILCAEIPCWEGDTIWNTSDDDLAAQLGSELVTLGLPPIPPKHVESRRLPRVYPIYRPGFAADLADLEQWAKSLPGLLTFGRQGLFTPDNTHHALAMGWAAAEALSSSGDFDDASWTRARDGFRSFVVED